MTDEMRCRWRGSELPRGVVGRHEGGCEDEDCKGCEPCQRAHCRCCGVRHDDGACADCLAAVRESIGEIERMCDDLPVEAIVRGVDGEAFNLLGPVCDPEALGHMEASVLAGRIPKERLETIADDLHPTFVAERWSSVYREAFDHDEPVGRVHLGTELGYLRRNLTEAAVFPWVPFEDLASDLRRCVAHLERVLHDGEQRDEGVPCMTCGRALTRLWGRSEAEDGWECQRCREKSTEAQYRFAVKADYIANAEWLTDVDMATRTGVKAGTVRQWALRGKVTKRIDSERVVYSVAEVEGTRDAGELGSSGETSKVPA